MISVNNLSVGYGGHFLYEDVSFLINRNDKIGLAGKNGAGKSTLLKILAGQNRPESGEVAMPRDATVGYLPQDLKSESMMSVIDETRTAFRELLEIRETLDRVHEEVATRTDYESDSYTKLLEKMTDLEHAFSIGGGYEMDEKTERILKGLGFAETDFPKPLKEFSGGWQMRVELAKILLRRPDLILLDEPTNHLDIESVIWLEEFLSEYPKAVMLVSHDKLFLDKVTNRTLEISSGQIHDYRASYTRYLELRAERREQLLSAARNQQSQIAQMERNIDRFRAKASKASFAQSLIKKLDKIDRIEVEEEDVSAIRFRFPEASHSGRIVFNADNVTKNYGEKKVIRGFTMQINRGDRIAFVGKNGMGKTTLSRILAEDLAYDSGKLEPGYNVLLGYYAQHQSTTLNPDNTVLEEMEKAAYTSDVFTQVRAILGAFLFSGDDVYKKVKVLSGGEKSRLALARMLLSPLNTLILDEPTNHLDLRSKEVLKNALLEFKGTLVVVSHDRDFLKGLTDKTFEFTPFGIKEHLGGIDEFLNRKKADNFRAIENKKEEKSAAVKTESTADNRIRNNDRDLKKLQQAVKNSERKIEELEKEIATYEQTLQDPVTCKKAGEDPAFYATYEELKRNLEREMKIWEEKVEEYEAASSASR